MQIKNLTLGLGMLIAGTALAHPQTYKVRNGDCDWTIARKFDTTIHKLHLANPTVRDWDALRNGFVLKIPATGASRVVASSKHSSKSVSRTTSTRPYVVKEDDNDWIIAHHLGVTLHEIHQLNPTIEWNRLRPGKHILVPSDGSGHTTVASNSKKPFKLKVNRIRSHFAVVNADDVTIRRDAGQGAERITTVDSGTRVVVLDRDGAWYKLKFPRGTEGWVRGDFLNASHAPTHRHSSEEAGQRVAVRRTARKHHRSGPETTVALDSDTKAIPVINRAVAMRGTRYSYGSSSRSGTDCSGFTWQVYGSQGIHLPRTSSEQSHVGKPIKTNQLKPGDLVFFSGTRGGRGVGHVGIYVGKNKFIHASSGAGHVTYNSLSDPYYANHYKGARRVLKATPHKTAVAKAEHQTHAPVTHSETSADTNPTPLGK